MRYDDYDLIDQGFDPWSAAWYRAWKDEHLKRYPNLDRISIDNIDMMIDMAEKREAAQA